MVLSRSAENDVVGAAGELPPPSHDPPASAMTAPAMMETNKAVIVFMNSRAATQHCLKAVSIARRYRLCAMWRCHKKVRATAVGSAHPRSPEFIRGPLSTCTLSAVTYHSSCAFSRMADYRLRSWTLHETERWVERGSSSRHKRAGRRHGGNCQGDLERSFRARTTGK